ncbi:hypothetical protein CON65_06595 [Bacillus pseudomycoides]|uniref:Uncharacterized protein n=1 Tax=Bacillus pseudomycoides TaxID=64104 RepID=A0AA91VDZ6_9BACI|nr:hypothetical protein COO03_12325 [Bacillus sp. AFS098217]PED83536.1 hypothetical protein CON65_06595 [Bacillus pseudomycoides]PEU06971.1 hypothetical protein CN524_22120 [Bacillus sp. AFS019443]PEU21955.1 hypothetical protein CN525_00710 [Bacillus sp. AFS014408]PFW63166.1 hypothetical protein COL20_09995 [Bacillus sp. AFS075034]
MVGGFASSYEAKVASMSEAPSTFDSKRAASTFKDIQFRRQALRV